jgi:hypothetical protein
MEPAIPVKIGPKCSPVPIADQTARFYNADIINRSGRWIVLSRATMNWGWWPGARIAVVTPDRW